jgi:hypothetical protein
MGECADDEVEVWLRGCRGAETRLERSAKGGRDLAAYHCGRESCAVCSVGVCDCDGS